MQRSTDERFERVFDYMEAHEEPRQKVFFEVLAPGDSSHE